MGLRHLGLILVWAMGFQGPAGAADILELTLEKARQIALDHNPQLKLAREAVLKSEAQVSGARAGLLPSIQAFSSYQKAWELPTLIVDNPFGAGKMEFKLGSENTVRAGVTLQQPLFAGGAIWNGYRMSLDGKAITAAQLQAVRQEVLLNVTSAYYGVLFARSVVTVMEEGLENSRRNLDQVKKTQAVGKASNFDVLRAEVQAANYQPLVVSALNAVQRAESYLRQVLGISGNPHLRIEETLIFREDPLTGRPLEELVSRALQDRPEVRIMREQRDISEKQLALARAALAPSLFLGTSYQYQGERDDFQFTGGDFYKSFNSSLSLSIPVFSGWGTMARIQQARIGRHEVEHQREALLGGLRLEVENAYLTVHEAAEKVQVQEKIIQQATEALRLAGLRYAQGSSTQLDVMNAEWALNQAKLNYQQSLFEYNTALAQLKKAINNL